MGNIVCICNHKGGVGKTNSTCNIGAGLAKLGRRVLLVDLDPQCNLTRELGVPTDEECNTYRLLRGDCTASQAIHSVHESLHIIPASIDLARSHDELQGETARERFLKTRLEEVRDHFDYILIDCLPGAGNLVANALAASDRVLIPVSAEVHAINGLGRMMQMINNIKALINPELEVAGLYVTFLRQTALHRDLRESLRETFGEKLFNTAISLSISIPEAVALKVDIFRYAPKSKVAKQYMALCKELIQRIESKPSNVESYGQELQGAGS